MTPFYSDMRAFREIYSLRGKLILCLLGLVAAIVYVVLTERPAPSAMAAPPPSPVVAETVEAASFAEPPSTVSLTPVPAPAATGATPLESPVATEHAPVPPPAAIIRKTRAIASSAPPSKKPVPSEVEPDVGF